HPEAQERTGGQAPPLLLQLPQSRRHRDRQRRLAGIHFFRLQGLSRDGGAPARREAGGLAARPEDACLPHQPVRPPAATLQQEQGSGRAPAATDREPPRESTAGLGIARSYAAPCEDRLAGWPCVDETRGGGFDGTLVC